LLTAVFGNEIMVLLSPVTCKND